MRIGTTTRRAAHEEKQTIGKIKERQVRGDEAGWVVGVKARTIECGNEIKKGAKRRGRWTVQGGKAKKETRPRTLTRLCLHDTQPDLDFICDRIS